MLLQPSALLYQPPHFSIPLAPFPPPFTPHQREDLASIVAGYLSGVVAGAPVDAVVDFYLAAKAEAVGSREQHRAWWW